ncbi:unnamed protein product, partial [Owenia fusiformis]
MDDDKKDIIEVDIEMDMEDRKTHGELAPHSADTRIESLSSLDFGFTPTLTDELLFNRHDDLKVHLDDNLTEHKESTDDKTIWLVDESGSYIPAEAHEAYIEFIDEGGLPDYHATPDIEHPYHEQASITACDLETIYEVDSAAERWTSGSDTTAEGYTDEEDVEHETGSSIGSVELPIKSGLDSYFFNIGTDDTQIGLDSDSSADSEMNTTVIYKGGMITPLDSSGGGNSDENDLNYSTQSEIVYNSAVSLKSLSGLAQAISASTTEASQCDKIIAFYTSVTQIPNPVIEQAALSISTHKSHDSNEETADVELYVPEKISNTITVNESNVKIIEFVQDQDDIDSERVTKEDDSDSPDERDNHKTLYNTSIDNIRYEEIQNSNGQSQNELGFDNSKTGVETYQTVDTMKVVNDIDIPLTPVPGSDRSLDLNDGTDDANYDVMSHIPGPSNDQTDIETRTVNVKLFSDNPPVPPNDCTPMLSDTSAGGELSPPHSPSLIYESTSHQLYADQLLNPTLTPDELVALPTLKTDMSTGPDTGVTGELNLQCHKTVTTAISNESLRTLGSDASDLDSIDD